MIDSDELDTQDEFDITIGRLDRMLSKLVGWGRAAKSRREKVLTKESAFMDEANQQTLKHHAEDMVAAAQKILCDLGKEVEATPQP